MSIMNCSKIRNVVGLAVAVSAMMFVGCGGDDGGDDREEPPPATTYTVTFNANGASGTPPAKLTANAGSSVTIPAQGSLTKSGYDFDGWNTNNSGTGTNYTVGSSYTPTANVTLYAKWVSSDPGTDPCDIDPQSSPSCPGYVDPGTDPCDDDPQSSPSCPGYVDPGTDPCDDDPQSSPSCPGYVDPGTDPGFTPGSQFNPNINYTTFTDSRDTKSYKSVTINGKVWMAENLNFETADSKCYGDDPANCAKYGKLYTFDDANIACPVGWHLPSNEEWDTLMQFVNPSCSTTGSCAGAGAKLKATSGWNTNGNGTDDYGFSALPGGGYDGSFSAVGDRGLWWSSTEGNSDYAYYRDMYSYSSDVYRSGYPKSILFSVRCVQ